MTVPMLVRVLVRHAHERKAELLASEDALEWGRYLPAGATDSNTVALLTRLHRLRDSLMTEFLQFQVRGFREDELVVVVPQLDLPEPDSDVFDGIRWYGMGLVHGDIDDRYRVALLADFTVHGRREGVVGHG